MTPTEQKKAAKRFVERWKEAEGNEQRESNSFWIELYGEVLGVPNPTHVLDFERKAKGKRIDVFHEDMGVLIENKSRGVSLDEPEQRGWIDKAKGIPRMVTPFHQAKDYANDLPYSTRPRWIVTCNFDEMRIYDLDAEWPEKQYEYVLLDELPEQCHRLQFLVSKANSRAEREKELSVEAGYIVGKLYDAFAKKYVAIDTDEAEQRSLNILITRLVFLLYAEDADILNVNDQFYSYLKNFQVGHMRQALIDLFDVLNTLERERDPYLSPELTDFPYIDGGLFAEKIVIPQFDEDLRFMLLQEASADFDWRDISPTIFGAVFESTLNPETRRAGGMHYTTIECIHKLTGPLFYDGLVAELAAIEGIKSKGDRDRKLRLFKKRLGTLDFLDPACGSGNFLTETYISLRKLENRVLEDLHGGQMAMGETVDVTINQFHGIEINDFAVEVAKTALWIAELQMNKKTMEQIDGIDIDSLPLSANDSIVCGNALRMDWGDIIPAEQCDYIVGNPPFLGYSNLSDDQKTDRASIFGDVNTVDYVACWYAKASEYTKGHHIRSALVSTNSICQGQQVKPIWDRMFSEGNHIDFCWRTFVWNSEAVDQAHVHCVIVGFSREDGVSKTIFMEDGTAHSASNINGYLEDRPNISLERRKASICNALPMVRGCGATDGGNLILESEERTELVAKCKAAEKWIKPFSMGAEYINGKDRYCLWLVGITRDELDAMPPVQERVERVREMRLASKKAATRKKAEKPWLFDEVRPPQGGSYIAVPKVSSGRREYVPMGFVTNGMIPGDMLFYIDNAGLYEFGVLMSCFHNAWVRSVAGRLKSDYRYNNTIVYNDFVWPDSTPEQRATIEACAQAVLDARDNYPEKSLADLYDPDKMPEDLLAAHKALDRAVEAAYGVDFDGDEEKIVAHLFKLYAEKTEGE